jgi:hypothetical protein
MIPTKIMTTCHLFFENVALLSARLKIPVIDQLIPNETIILFGSHSDPSLFLNFQKKNPIQYMIIQSENIESTFFDPNSKYADYIELCKNNIVFNYSLTTSVQLEKKFGIKNHGLFEWEFIQRKPLPRKIDILFYGYPSIKRQLIEKRLKKILPLNIVFLYSTYNTELLDHLLVSEYVLNIPYFSKSALETHRIDQALACGCKVITKRSSCNYLNKKYEKKVIFIDDYDDIQAKVQ